MQLHLSTLSSKFNHNQITRWLYEQVQGGKQSHVEVWEVTGEVMRNCLLCFGDFFLPSERTCRFVTTGFNLGLPVIFRSNTTFKLKHRVRVCELWLATCLDEVSEATTLTPDKSFVIGWPTANTVVTFATPEMKELWLSKVKESVCKWCNDVLITSETLITYD